MVTHLVCYSFQIYTSTILVILILLSLHFKLDEIVPSLSKSQLKHVHK